MRADREKEQREWEEREKERIVIEEQKQREMMRKKRREAKKPNVLKEMSQKLVEDFDRYDTDYSMLLS